MSTKNAQIATFLFCALLLGASLLSAYFAPVAIAQTQPTASGQAAIAKSLGPIKAIDGNVITVAPESGPEVTANVQPNARILRLTPGDKDLKNATPISLQDLHVGDTVRVRGYASTDGK